MKVFIVGLTFAAAIVGGSIGYASLKTGAAPAWQQPKAVFSESPEADEKTVIESVESNQTTRSDPSNVERELKVEGEPKIERETGVERESDRTSRPVTSNDIVISEAELNQKVSEAIAADPTAASILAKTGGIATTLEDDRIESGITLNLAELPREELPIEAQTAVDEMLKTFPFLAYRDVYLGIEGRPNVVDGEISLGDANIKFGPLTLPVSNVAGQLGVSQADIEKQLNLIMRQQGLTPTDVYISDGQIVITGL